MIEDSEMLAIGEDWRDCVEPLVRRRLAIDNPTIAALQAENVTAPPIVYPDNS